MGHAQYNGHHTNRQIMSIEECSPRAQNNKEKYNALFIALSNYEIIVSDAHFFQDELHVIDPVYKQTYFYEISAVLINAVLDHLLAIYIIVSLIRVLLSPLIYGIKQVSNQIIIMSILMCKKLRWSSNSIFMIFYTYQFVLLFEAGNKK